MKYRFLTILSALAITACYPDYVDINTSAIASQQESEMTLDVRVSGSMISTKSFAGADEMEVDDMDIFIFASTENGYLLEWTSKDVTPDLSEAIPGSKDKKIWSQAITLPSSGSKRIVVIGNTTGAEYPAVKTTTEDPEGATEYNAFADGLKFSLNQMPTAPLFMMGQTDIASSVGTNPFVTLARQFAKVDIKAAGLELKSVQMTKTSTECWPLVKDFEKKPATMGQLPAISVSGSEVKDQIYLLYTPGTQSETTDNRAAFKISGTASGQAFEDVVYCPNPVMADYNYVMTLSQSGGKLFADFTPDWSSGTLTVQGVKLINGQMTFPYLSEKYYGYELTWTTEMTGPIVLTKNGDESWYNVFVDGSLIRVCCVEDNYTGAERSATFTVSLGKSSVEISLTQQSVPTQTVKFGNMEWMDRNLGATLPSFEENIISSESYGYYYQWGRNVPFPNVGTLETDKAPDALTYEQAMNSRKFYSPDAVWLRSGVSYAKLETFWKDLSGSYGEPCPEGWHIPSYYEIQQIIPYKNSAGIGNFNNIGTKLNPDEIFEKGGPSYDGLYVTAGPEKCAIYAIKKYKTTDAYYLRIQRMLRNSIAYLKIDRLPGDENSDFAGEDANAKLASAEQIFATADASKMETLCFPSTGYINQTSGEHAYQGQALYMWASSAWSDVYASTIYFDNYTGTSNNSRIYSRANNFAHGMPVRCVKD